MHNTTARPAVQKQTSNRWWIAPLIVLLTCLAYIPAMRSGFIWDDDYYVHRNLALRSFDGLVKIWNHLGTVPQYYPLTHTTFWIEHQLWGNAPTGYHIINVLLHATSAIVLWRLLRRLHVPGASVIALLFAVHPVHVESVAWITERKNVLSGFFYLLASTIYWRMLDDPDEQHEPRFCLGLYFLAFALFIAALLSKTVTSSLPAAILLVLWWKRGRLSWRDVAPIIPMLAVGAAMGMLTSYMERVEVNASGPDWNLSFLQRICIAGRAVWFYASKLLLPTDLTFIYPRWQIRPHTLAPWLFPIAAIAVVAALLILRKRIGRGPLVCVLFFGGTLFPALGFVNTFPMLYSFVADHFQYLASIGILALVVASIASVRQLPSPAKATLASLAICVCVILTWRQSRIYRDLPTLWTDTLQKNPHAWMAANNLAFLYVTEAETAPPDRKLELVRQARPLLEQCLSEKPDYLNATLNLGRVYEALGESARARELWQSIPPMEGKANTKAWQIAASDAMFYIGRQYHVAGDRDNALRSYARALKIADEQHVPSLTQVGALLASSGNYADAIAYVHKAAELSPDTPSVWTNLGNIHMQYNQPAQAADAYGRALQIKPDHIPARYGQAIAQITLGQRGPAEITLRQLLQQRPDSPEALSALAGLCIQSGRLAEARQLLEQALQIRPGFPAALQQMQLLQQAAQQQQ